jgi:hypothetical protein
VLLVVALGTTAACHDTDIAATALPVTPTPPPLNAIEFRVSGTALSARIRFSDPRDGLSQVVSALPYVVDTATRDTTIFLSLDVTPLSFPFVVGSPFMSAQIIVNQAVFREATSSDTSGATLSVSGTWRAF